MNATLWKEYGECVRTISEFALESTESGGEARLGTSAIPPPVPSETILQWLTCFQVTEKAMKEVDVRSVLAFVQAEPGKQGKKVKKNFRSGVADVLLCGQKRQELLYGNMPFSELQEKCVRWTTLIYYWIHARVTRCGVLVGPNGLEHDEVERYLHFLGTASPLLGAFPTDEVESLLLSLDKGKHSAAPKCGMSDDTQQLHSALADCVDAANKDSLLITWDFIRPSSIPTIVLEHLGEYAGEWLNSSKALRPVSLTEYLRTFSSRKPHRRSSSTPPQSSSFLALQYLWETKSTERRFSFSPRTLYQFEWTIEHIGYLMLAQLSSEKIDRAYFAIPVLVDLTCAVEAYKELCAKGDKDQIAAIHKAVPSLSNSPDSVVKAMESAVDLCFERHARDILRHYHEMDFSKDLIKIDGSKHLVVSKCMFRLLVEIIEPTLCLLRRYAEVLESSTSSCPCWQRGLERSIESIWKIVASSNIRAMETIHPSGDSFRKRLKVDERLLNSYMLRL